MFCSGGKGHNCHFWVINDHFGGPSVHCGQILQKNPGKGQSPPPFLAMPAFWVHMVPQPIPKRRSFSIIEPSAMSRPTGRWLIFGPSGAQLLQLVSAWSLIWNGVLQTTKSSALHIYASRHLGIVNMPVPAKSQKYPGRILSNIQSVKISTSGQVASLWEVLQGPF